MIYLASPYTHPREEVMQERFEAVCDLVAHYIFRQREPIFSPILYGHALTQQHDLPPDFGAWSRFNYGMLRFANELWILKIDGWDTSKGVAAEIDFAIKFGIQIKYVLPNGSFVV
jgi:hypothetical protein